ncbi:SMI1/KNR4 family protein [Myroides marinus]|uniref:SMI1/KNR4 family protein n=1 Tax=Myroides marinus TaxID=703342 RepID=UPI002575DAF3|nr:SMI1/KNR4 family protein [Myroides marinus]MDM1373867.1 SMI1/KNR4 family protein [Myroides marinus]
MENINEILLKNGWQMRAEKLNINFENIEKNIGFKIPEDFKKYASIFYGNENFIGNEYVILWDAENELMENNFEYEILNNLNNVFAIGGNGGGEFIAIQNLNDGNVRIILCPFVPMEENYFIEIGNSFSDFLIRLNNGKEWFD